jgi:protein BCP1
MTDSKKSQEAGIVKMMPPKIDDTSSESSNEEDEDLILEGVIMRNPEVSDSDDTSSEEEEDDDDSKPPPSKKQKAVSSSNTDPSDPNKEKKKRQSKKKKKPRDGPEVVQVDFTFCDMDEKYFHGLKTLLTSSSPMYAAQSSDLADLMIRNVSVGTVISTEGDVDGTIFGFASVLNVTTYQEETCIQELKKLCLDKCPPAHKSELQTVLSGKTKRPAGFYLQGRMVNLPLEIVEVLHQQLVLDMDWAIEKAEGVDRKSLDFGAFVRIAPAYQTSGVTYYKYFDDEVFSTHAEFTFEMELPKTFGIEEAPFCVALVMTKTRHRAAMKALKEMVNLPE